MPYPSPYDLIRGAKGRATPSDRWAALQANTTERQPTTPPMAVPQDVIQPPPMPPPRHAIYDAIKQRHAKAAKAVTVTQAWEKTR